MQRHDLASKVLHYFQEISRIPRGTGNEEQIGKWLEAFGKDRGLTVMRDKHHNVVICKPGQNGGEHAPVLILQAHSDMVCEKVESSTHDFQHDPIRLVEKDGWLMADGTTLGADNGIGVALICMVLADNTIRHPPIEAVITSGEEVGMVGMSLLDTSCLHGKRMINLDAEENGVLLASCAGGARSTLTLPISRGRPKDGYRAYRIKISGLAGGHSGVDIHRGTGNAILLLGRTLDTLLQEDGVQVCDISGGTATNVIAGRAEAVVYADPFKQAQLETKLAELRQLYNHELVSADKGLVIELCACAEAGLPFTAQAAEMVVHCIALLPYGALRFHEDLPGQVSLSNNPGVLTTTESAVVIQSLTRGNCNSATDWVVRSLYALAALGKGDLEIGNTYSAWEYHPDSPLRELALQSYKRQLGHDMTVCSIHGGLECALMAEKVIGLDMISLGLTLLDVHTPNERFEIKAAEEFWTYFIELLAEELSS